MGPKEIARMITEDPDIINECKGVLAEWRQRWFHGTSIKKLKTILSKGLDPKAAKETSVADAVYLSGDPTLAMAYGHRISHKGRWLLIEIDADSEIGTPDEDELVGIIDDAWYLYGKGESLEDTLKKTLPDQYVDQIVKLMLNFASKKAGGLNFDTGRFKNQLMPILNQMKYFGPEGAVGTESNIRVLEPIGFEGENRIVAIYLIEVEHRENPYWHTAYVVKRLLYGNGVYDVGNEIEMGETVF